MKLKCKCGKMATWAYVPAEEEWVCCDDCVPRGCSCWNNKITFENGDFNYPKGVEGKDWFWIEKYVYWEELDGEGKQLPCCEWWYNKEGWDDEN